MTRSLRFLLGAQLGAVVALSSGVLLALGLPLAARGALGPGALTSLVLGAGAVAVLAGLRLLSRTVAGPVDRLLSAAARLGAATAAGEGGEAQLPLLGEEGGHALSRAAIAFERLGVRLERERARLAEKVDELTRANRSLADARESLVRAERLATTGRLAAGLAHEIGNPLGAITGYVELGRSRLPAGVDPELGGALDRIDSAAARIDRTVRDLLDLARPSKPSLSAVQLAPAVETALRLVRVQPRFGEVQVEVHADGAPPALAEEHQLVQVLVNLLLNAADAMAGAGAVEVAAAAGESPGTVALAVADTGPGIEPRDQERLFEPFFTTKGPGQGSGLGLAISRSIVESFGGRIEAGNRCPPGRGAVFTIVLPVAGGGRP